MTDPDDQDPVFDFSWNNIPIEDFTSQQDVARTTVVANAKKFREFAGMDPRQILVLSISREVYNVLTSDNDSSEWLFVNNLSIDIQDDE